MVEWLLGFVVKWVIGQDLFIGLLIAATMGGAVFLTMYGQRTLATLTVILGLSLTGFTVGLNVADHVCSERIQAIEDELQRAIAQEQARQAEAREQLRRLQIENAQLSERAAQQRIQTVREIRREVRINPDNCTFSDSELRRLQDLAAGRRKPVGD